jgi:hypothetical protein
LGGTHQLNTTVNCHCISGGRIQFNVGTKIHHDPLYDDLPITNVAKVTPGTLYQFILHECSTNLFTQAEQLYHVARIRFPGLEIDQLSTLNVFRSWPQAQDSRQHQDGIPYLEGHPPEFLAGLRQLANSKSVIQQISRLQLLRPSMQYPSLSVLQQALGCESPSELMFIPVEEQYLQQANRILQSCISLKALSLLVATSPSLLWNLLGFIRTFHASWRVFHADACANLISGLSSVFMVGGTDIDTNPRGLSAVQYMEGRTSVIPSRRYF